MRVRGKTERGDDCGTKAPKPRAAGERQADLQVREEGEEEAALDRLIDLMVDRVPIEPELEAVEVMEREFMCRACHLIFSRSCLADDAWMLCADCVALAGAGPVPTGEVPHVRRAHHPCPACGALMMVPEREEVSCGFVCPSCRVHLTKREGRLHLVWNHREAVGGEEVER